MATFINYILNKSKHRRYWKQYRKQMNIVHKQRMESAAKEKKILKCITEMQGYLDSFVNKNERIEIAQKISCLKNLVIKADIK